MQKPWPIFLAILCLSTAGCKQSEKQLPAELPKVRIQEGYSEAFTKALQQQDEAIGLASPDMSFTQAQSIRSVLRTWPNKKVIKVGFKGGSAELRKQISLDVRLVCLRLERNQLNRKKGGFAGSGKYGH